MENFCFLNDREYEIIKFKNFEETLDEILKASKNKNKVLLNFSNIKITPKILSYMLKVLRISNKENFEVIYIIEDKESIEDKNLIESKRYFKIFNSIEEYNNLKVFSNFEVKIYDDNLYIRNLIKDELVRNGFSIKERNSSSFLNKKHECNSNSIYVLDFTTYREEKVREIKKIKEINKDSIIILIVFEDDVDYALDTMKYGVDRVVKRPIDVNYFVGMLKNMAISSNLKNENNRLINEVFDREKEISKLYNIVSQELKIAGDIQKSMLPPKKIKFNNYEIEYIFLPSMNIGGDFCDFIKINEDKFAVVFADISGHGISAALLSSMLKVLIYNHATKKETVSELLENINEEIIGVFPKGKFVSMFYLLVDTKNNIVQYSKASQEPGLIYRNDTNVVEELNSDGQILGLFSKKIFENLTFEEKSIKINNKDEILLYTDGIIEEMDNNGNYYGIERLKKQMKDSSLDDIINDLKKFIFKDSFDDDVTLLKIKRED